MVSGVALVFSGNTAKGGDIDGAAYRRHMALARGARLIFAAHVGRMMRNRVFGLQVGLRSGIFAGAILVAVGVTPVHAQSGDPISPPANTVGPADSTPSPDHVRKPTEPPPFDSNRPAARAARVKATPPAAPAPEAMRRSPRHRRRDRYRRRRRERQNRRRTRHRPGPRLRTRHPPGPRNLDGPRRRSIRGRSRLRLPPPYRARRRASARSIRGRSRRRRQLGTGARRERQNRAARDQCPRPAARRSTPYTGVAHLDAPATTIQSVGGAGDGASSRIAPDGARALERSVGGAGDGANSRIAPDDAAALGAGQGDRHRFAGALERGSATRAVAGGAPAAWCRRRGGTRRDHRLGPERRGLGAGGRRVAEAEVLQRPFDVGVAEDLAQPPGGRAAQRGQ